MIFDIIREIFSAVISFLQMPISLDSFTFSFYDILTGLIVLYLAIFFLGKILGGGDD